MVVAGHQEEAGILELIQAVTAQKNSPSDISMRTGVKKEFKQKHPNRTL